MTRPRLTHAAGQTRTEEQAREENREQSLADLRAAAKRDGVSDRMTREGETSLRAAFMFNDLLGSIVNPIMGEGK